MVAGVAALGSASPVARRFVVAAMSFVGLHVVRRSAGSLHRSSREGGRGRPYTLVIGGGNLAPHRIKPTHRFRGDMS